MPSTPEIWLDAFRPGTDLAGAEHYSQFRPSGIQLSDGRMAVFWADNTITEDNSNYLISSQGQILDQLGGRVGQQFVLDPVYRTPEEFGEMDAAPLENGGFVVVRDNLFLNNLRAVELIEWSVDSAGLTSIEARHSLSNDFIFLGNVSVASQPDGSYMVLYQSEGSTVTHILPVATDGTLGETVDLFLDSERSSSDVEIAALTSGQYIVAKEIYDRNTDQSDIEWAVLDSSGRPVEGTGGPPLAGTGPEMLNDTWASVIGLTGGGFAISWSEETLTGSQIAVQTFDVASGSGETTTYATNGDVTYVTNASGGFLEAGSSELIALQDGGFVVVFEPYNEVFSHEFQRFDASGEPVGDIVVVESSGIRPDGFGLADGRFVVTSVLDEGDDASAQVQIFDPRDGFNDPVYTPDSWQIGTVGDDVFSVVPGTNFAHAWDGNDSMMGSDQSDLLHTGVGDDTAIGGSGDDTLIGRGGFDLLVGEDGADFMIGGADDDTLLGGGGNDDLNAGAGADSVMGGEGNDTLLGVAGDDFLHAGIGFDSVDGGDGNDELRGLNGFDTLIGGDGQDTLLGGFGNDSLEGGLGADNLNGGLGFDWLSGGDGNDTLIALDGADTLDGGAGDDSMTGNAGFDSLMGGEGNDMLFGGIANDTLEGGAGNDTLGGDAGFDSLLGGLGDDSLLGNAANDTLDGGGGNDTLFGGQGADVFVFTSGADVIQDYSSIVDTLQIEADLLTQTNPVPQDLRGYITSSSDGSQVLDFGNGNTLTFTGLSDISQILDSVTFI